MGDAEYEKTKLVLSIAVNLLINSDDCTVIFIDTMKNFSAVAVFENFQARQIATDVSISV